MRVLHVIPSISPVRGGPSETIRAIVHGLASAGVHVEVVTTDDDGAGRLHRESPHRIIDGAWVHCFPRQSRFYTFSSSLTIWLARHVKDFHIVHIHSLFSYPAVIAGFFANRCGVPYVVRPLGVLNRWGMRYRRRWLKKVSYSLIERQILNGAAAVHYTSEYERREAGDLGSRDRAVIIPNPVNAPVYSRVAGRQFLALYPQVAGRLVILFLSRLDRKKGVDLLLAAFAKVHAKHPETILVIAGAGDRRFTAELHDQAAHLGIREHIVWTGFLNAEQKSSAFAAADLYVLPSRSENFGVAAVEAMAAGLAVVVTDQVGIHETIAGATAGLVTRCNADSLTSAIIHLLRHPALRARMGSNGKRLRENLYSTEAVSEQLLDLYEGARRSQSVGRPGWAAVSSRTVLENPHPA
jgi:glycosyltransferase involved in cell wall biosynthesis